METAEKIRENRLRRMAERQGFALHKSRRRDPRALDFGTYELTSRVPMPAAGDDWARRKAAEALGVVVDDADVAAALSTFALTGVLDTGPASPVQAVDGAVTRYAAQVAELPHSALTLDQVEHWLLAGLAGSK